MKITICGSIAFYDEMQEVSKKLEELGHQVDLPPFEIKNKEGKMISIQEYYAIRKAEKGDDSWIWERKAEAIMMHFKKIEWSDCILVLNYVKNGIEGYIGANTLIEMGLAFYLGKPIYLYDVVPEMGCREEILGMKPKLISKNFEAIDK
jgi:nucleoside 2-deoxyribosyltransferase